MKADKEKNIKNYNKILGLMTLYSIIMLLTVIFSLSISKQHINNVPIVSEKIEIQTEYIYVKAEVTTIEESGTTVSNEKIYIIREHMNVIGIFLPDGTLFDTIDVYVKTLPEADRRLLREGFEITGDTALGEIIQDYGS